MGLSSVASQEPANEATAHESSSNPPNPQLAPFEQRSKRIRVYKNGDVYHPGKKLVVSGRIYRNWEQFLHTLSSQVELLNGAVHKVFTVEGKPVRSLDELEENGNYVAAGRESFRRVPYPVLVGLAEQQLIQFKGEMSPEMASKAAALIAEQKRRVYGKPTAPVITPTLSKKKSAALEEGARNRGKRPPRDAGKVSEDSDKHGQEADAGGDKGDKEVPIFGPSTKAFRVVLFANDEPGYQGKVLVLNNRNCKYFDQLLKNVSDMMHLKNGSVQKLFDAETGQRIRMLQQLRDGQNIVCTGYEPFRRIQYNTFNPSDHEKKTTLSEHTKSITVYMNGDPYHTGFIITVKESRFPNMVKLMDHISNKAHSRNGRSRRLYRIDGTGPVATTEELEAGGRYVFACGDETFQKVQYNINEIKTAKTSAPLAGATMNNELMNKIRKPQAEKWPAAIRRLRSFSQQQQLQQPQGNRVDVPPTIEEDGPQKREKKASVKKKAVPPPDEELEEVAEVRSSSAPARRSDADDVYESPELEKFKSVPSRSHAVPAAQADLLSPERDSKSRRSGIPVRTAPKSQQSEKGIRNESAEEDEILSDDGGRGPLSEVGSNPGENDAFSDQGDHHAEDDWATDGDEGEEEEEEHINGGGEEET